MGLLFELDKKNVTQLLSEVQVLQFELDELNEQIKLLQSQKRQKEALYRKTVKDAIQESKTINLVS